MSCDNLIESLQPRLLFSAAFIDPSSPILGLDRSTATIPTAIYPLIPFAATIGNKSYSLRPDASGVSIFDGTTGMWRNQRFGRKLDFLAGDQRAAVAVGKVACFVVVDSRGPASTPGSFLVLFDSSSKRVSQVKIPGSGPLFSQILAIRNHLLLFSNVGNQIVLNDYNLASKRWQKPVEKGSTFDVAEVAGTLWGFTNSSVFQYDPKHGNWIEQTNVVNQPSNIVSV